MIMGAVNGIPVGRLLAEINGFVGRRRELAQVKRLLAQARLVTLTGVGGSGKTRLAVQVAAESHRRFADGVWLVDLASVTDATLIVHEVARTLDLRDQTQRPLPRVVVDFLRERDVLLLLDNCEHLLDGCAAFAVSALREAAGLRLLCTSRQPLDVPGEAVWIVPGLPCPEPDQPLRADATIRCPALALFAQRADAVSPGFALTADTTPIVAEICRRLDGLPLAIELAASQLRMLSLDQLAILLRDGFPALSGVRTASPAWHRTLEAAFEWSYRLCSPAERLAWERASVFAGGFELAAAERVCAGPGLAAGEVLAALAGLVDKSVLTREERPTTRYRLPATVQGFGLARLRAADADAEPALRLRHRDWYLDLTGRFDAEWFGPDQVAWGERIRVELPNLRAALDFCLDTPGETQAALTLAADMMQYWLFYRQTNETYFWYERALAADPSPTLARSRALSAYSLVLHTQAGDEDMVRARECIELANRLDDADMQAHGRKDLGVGLLMSGSLAEARLLLDGALEYFVARGRSDFDIMQTKLMLAMTTHHQGDPGAAAKLLADCRAICRRHRDEWWLGSTLLASSLIMLALGDPAGAAEYARESLLTRIAREDALGIAASMERLAWIESTRGDSARAARLLGAAGRLWDQAGQTLYGSPRYIVGHRECETRGRRALGDRAYEKSLREGAALTVDEAIRYALDTGRTTRPAPGPPDRRPRTELDTLLTPREREVTELITRGLSNKQIAARLLLAQRTAESHVENILRKLGFSSRTQIASWAASQHSDHN